MILKRQENLTDKYKNEQELINQGPFSLQIPFSISNKHCYPKRTIAVIKPFKEEFETTSRLPFNFDLDNTLFISTLTRHKQPETHKGDCIPSTSTSASSDSCYNMRRISIQSDTSNTTCYSTEPIRRFSSVSTTSSFSSISSSITNKRIPSPSLSSDIPTIMTSNNNNHKSAIEDNQQEEDDPGHTHCDTLHSPTLIATTPTELPLYQPCVFYFIDYNKSASLSVNIKPLFTCSTVRQFASGWRTVKNHTRVSRLQSNQNICCFVNHVQPLWEDEANRGGGRLLIYSQQLDNVFEWLLCALIGANLDDYVVGVVAAKKQYRDRVELWMNDKITLEQIPLFK
jgi:hypothetical protein